MQKLLFIDRDGTLIREPADYQIDAFEKLQFLPDAISSLRKIAEETDYKLVMVTNQDGLGTPSFPESHFFPPHHLMLQLMAGENIHFEAIHIDRSFPHQKLPTRKPGTAMLTAYLEGSYDLASSFVIGDRLTDLELARNLGCKAILLNPLDRQQVPQLDDTLKLVTDDWREIYRLLRLPPRTAEISRITKETQVHIRLNLDGSGQSEVETGIGFFDHMLDQVARHSGCDLSVKVKGDLHIDEHHTIEDTALALGEAFLKALGDKKGISRYGFLLPMDEALAQVALDFSGRPWLVWEAEFGREKIGDMPTEMFYHFFKSFSDTARCTLNIQVKGENEHHKIEAIFKAFAKSIEMAVSRKLSRMEILPSTKGVL
jgi:imidazoleglycerol-phosphate dehydratase/histidinol-phosphatase